MQKRVRFPIYIILSLCITVTCVIAAYQGLIRLRHHFQRRFSEIHALLSDQDLEDSNLSAEQIQTRDDMSVPIETPDSAISWKSLAKAQVRISKEKNKEILSPQYPDDLIGLNHKTITAKGFMFPLDPGIHQTHFLLSPYPSSCPFCLPAGPNELIEIRPKKAINFSLDPITVTGQFELLDKDEDLKEGMFYRVNDAILAKE